MIVLDASLVVELLTGGPQAGVIRHELARCDDPWIVPHLLDIEVASAIRGLTAGRRIEAERASRVIEELRALPAARCPHAPLLGRIWELRQRFTAYDAAYIALAEQTGATLYTCDAKLARGHTARVVVIGSGD